MSSVHHCPVIELPKIADHRGNLTFIEGQEHIPFPVRRVFYVYDIPSGQSRGAHAHHTLHEFIVCLSGGLDVELDDGASKRTVRLDRPWKGLHLKPKVWASIGNFNPGTVYIVLASEHYDEADYIRDYDEFIELCQQA